jgi:hypothetical protein
MSKWEKVKEKNCVAGMGRIYAYTHLPIYGQCLIGKRLP